MAQNDDEQLERIMRWWGGEAGHDPKRSKCPADEALAGYAAGELDRAIASSVEKHLSECRTCLQEVLLVRQAAQSEDASSEQVPRRVIDKAMALVMPADVHEVFDVTIEFDDEAVRLVATTGQVLPTDSPATLRQSSPARVLGPIRVAKVLNKLRVVLDVQLVDGEVCELVVRVQNTVESEPGPTRVTLKRRTRELASFRIQDGVAVFDRLGPGEYELAIRNVSRLDAPVKLTILRKMA